MSRLHLIHQSGDKEQDLRRLEFLSWRHYLRMSQNLAIGDPKRVCDARKRVEKAKTDWADALHALDEVLQW